MIVAGDIRFFAALPMMAADALTRCIGFLCLGDSRPRKPLSANLIARRLIDLAAAAVGIDLAHDRAAEDQRGRDPGGRA